MYRENDILPHVNSNFPAQKPQIFVWKLLFPLLQLIITKILDVPKIFTLTFIFTF